MRCQEQRKSGTRLSPPPPYSELRERTRFQDHIYPGKGLFAWRQQQRGVRAERRGDRKVALVQQRVDLRLDLRLRLVADRKLQPEREGEGRVSAAATQPERAGSSRARRTCADCHAPDAFPGRTAARARREGKGATQQHRRNGWRPRCQGSAVLAGRDRRRTRIALLLFRLALVMVMVMVMMLVMLMVVVTQAVVLVRVLVLVLSRSLSRETAAFNSFARDCTIVGVHPFLHATFEQREE